MFRLSYLDSAVRVTEARDVTNPKGQAWLDVSEDAAQRSGLRIVIDGAANLVIYQPADGQLAALPAAITVTMLPKGSPALLGPAQIEAMLHRTLLQVSSLQKQVTALKQNVAEAQAKSLTSAPPLRVGPRPTAFPLRRPISRYSNGRRESKSNRAQVTRPSKRLWRNWR